MTKTETSLLGTDIRVLTNNGISFMKMNTQQNQRRVNSTKTSVSTLIETSTLLLK